MMHVLYYVILLLIFQDTSCILKIKCILCLLMGKVKHTGKVEREIRWFALYQTFITLIFEKQILEFDYMNKNWCKITKHMSRLYTCIYVPFSSPYS